MRTTTKIRDLFDRRLARVKEHAACADAVAWAAEYTTPAEAWDACQCSDWMLWALEQIGYSDEKLRVFACWCVHETPLQDGRRVWDLLTDERSHNAVAVAERFARGEARPDELAAASAAARAASAAARAASAAARAASAAAWDASAAASAAAWDASAAARDAASVAARAASAAARAASVAAWDASAAAWAASAAARAASAAAWDASAAASAAQADALREIVGNPFRVKRRRKED